MKRALTPLTAGLALAFALAACGGGFRLNPVRANPTADTLLGAGQVALVQVQLSPDLAADKVRMLMNNNVPGEMQRVLTGLGSGPTPYTLVTTITRFRNGGFGPARMHTQTVVYEPSGQIVRQFDKESMSMRGGKLSRLIRIAQHNVQGIADAL